jgi:hypothetical protein
VLSPFGRQIVQKDLGKAQEELSSLLIWLPLGNVRHVSSKLFSSLDSNECQQASH